MPLMGSIYVGTSGLQTSQNSLNTTAHNLANMDTTGFVRQQALQGDRRYNTIKYASFATAAQQVGLGVTYSKVRQVRDYFLDESYRRESGRSTFYDSQYNAMTEVEDLLDELNDDASFNQSMTNFWSTLQELAKTPDDTVVQRMLIQNASSFLTNAKQVYQGLVDYQNEVNIKVREEVEKINALGDKIFDLNNKIRAIEVGGVETANDFRDARNQALDELANLANIEFDEDVYGSVSVRVEGVDFLAAGNVFKMNVVQDAQTGYYIPYWEIFATTAKSEDGINTFRDGETIVDITRARVFDTTETISTETNRDVGKLRALLYIRGDKVANYTDIPVKPTIPSLTDYGNDPVLYGQAVREYEDKLEKYEQDVAYYNQTISQSVCMNTEAEFDQLIHNVVTAVNSVLAQAADTTTGYMCERDADGNYYPIQIFQKIASDGYTFDDATGEYVFEEEITDNPKRTDTLYSIPNLTINPVLLREAGKMRFYFDDNTVDYETAKKLIEAFDKDLYVLNPNVTTTCSLNTYYSNLVSQIANSGAVYKNISESQQVTINSIDHAREQIIGVSSDEELSNMIRFQNAYNASSRYINVVNEMLEHLLTSLG